MVNDDTNAVDVLFFKKLTCKTRELCISQLQEVDASAEALLTDLKARPAPPVLAQQGAAMLTTTQGFIAELRDLIALMQQPGSDFVALSSRVDIHSLEVGAATVVCWPGVAVFDEMGESAIGYTCRR